MRVVAMVISGVLGAVVGSAASAQQTTLEEVCALCRAVGAKEASVAPSSGGAPAYERNLGRISNCLDRGILGDDRRFEATGYGQREIQEIIRANRWRETREDGTLCAPAQAGEQPACLSNSEKITALYLVMFGEAGFNAATAVGTAEQAQLTCQAMWADLLGASTRVTEAAK